MAAATAGLTPVHLRNITEQLGHTPVHWQHAACRDARPRTWNMKLHWISELRCTKIEFTLTDLLWEVAIACYIEGELSEDQTSFDGASTFHMK